MSDQWLKTVVLKLRDRWQSTTAKDPALLRRLRKTEIVITVAVERDGRLSKVQIRQSCGDASMDQTAQSSCQEASPVEAPPATLPTPVNLQLEFKNK
jgi:TonB family protein